MEASQLVSGAIVFALALAFLYVGRRFAAHSPPGTAGKAWWRFGLWWFGSSLNLALTAVAIWLAGAGVREPALFTTHAYLERAVVVVSVWGLSCYLTYLFTGRPALWRVITAVYAGVLFATVFSLTLSDPVGIVPGYWSRPRLVQVGEVPAWLKLASGIPLVAVPLAGALAYLGLVFRVYSRTQRYRVVLVSVGILVWYGSASVAHYLPELAWFQLVNRLAMLAGGGLILVAYLPPRWVRSRLGVAAIGERRAEAALVPAGHGGGAS